MMFTFFQQFPSHVVETITNHKITVTATMQLLISVYTVISTIATAIELDAWADSLLFPHIRGLFKKRPNFCYKNFIAHFTF